MNQRQAKREACHVLVFLIRSYRSVGQPEEECQEGSYEQNKDKDGWKEKDIPALDRAFNELEDEMLRRSGFDPTEEEDPENEQGAAEP
jgi:hypothetical protein